MECTPLTLFQKTIPHSCTAALLMAFSEFKKSKPFPLSKPSILTPIFKNIVYLKTNKDDSIQPSQYITVYVHFSGSIATPYIIA
jgi:hypothetical protein